MSSFGLTLAFGHTKKAFLPLGEQVGRPFWAPAWLATSSPSRSRVLGRKGSCDGTTKIFCTSAAVWWPLRHIVRFKAEMDSSKALSSVPHVIHQMLPDKADVTYIKVHCTYIRASQPTLSNIAWHCCLGVCNWLCLSLPQAKSKSKASKESNANDSEGFGESQRKDFSCSFRGWEFSPPHLEQTHQLLVISREGPLPPDCRQQLRVQHASVVRIHTDWIACYCMIWGVYRFGADTLWCKV